MRWWCLAACHCQRRRSDASRATPGRSGRELRGGDAVELRPAVEAGDPALAAEIDGQFDAMLAAHPVVAGCRVEQQVLQGGDGVEQFEFDVLVVGGDQAGQQVVGAEGAVGEAEQGGAALLDAGSSAWSLR